MHQSTAYRWPRDGTQYEVGQTSPVVVSDQVLNTRQVLGRSIPWLPYLRRILCKCTVKGKQSATVVAIAGQRRRYPPLPCSAPVTATYMQRSALSESRLSVPLRRFARRRAKEVRFSSMWSVYSSIFSTFYRADPDPDLYRSCEDSTY